MILEAPRVPEGGFGSLRSCLVEGDPLSEKRARRVKQRAVAVSIVLQTLALTALVLFPLLSKGERITLKETPILPPYPSMGHQRAAGTPRPRGDRAPQPCRICPPRRIPTTIAYQDTTTSESTDTNDSEPIIGFPEGPGVPNSILSSGAHTVPQPPKSDPEKTERRIISEGVQMAQLIVRVEPPYPPLARQIHREGRVELRAIISTEGTIESLEVLSGDPFFIQSALSAVRQWRYRPTILNGRPIEVDTHITVIYTLNH